MQKALLYALFHFPLMPYLLLYDQNTMKQVLAVNHIDQNAACTLNMCNSESVSSYRLYKGRQK